MTVAGFQTLAKIYEGEFVVVFRGQRLTDDVPVILKTLRGPYPSLESVARFRAEYELTRELESPFTIKALGFESLEGNHTIVLEDFGAQSLLKVLDAGPLGTETVLRLAIQCADALDAIHSRKVIHKDLNPSNIVWNSQSGALKLIDFGISTRLRERPSLGTSAVIEGTLGYVSPEQTGRMNRLLDYRSDYYSLGVTLYELLTGHLPFESKDPLELVHAHIARTPTPPHSLVSDVPQQLSKIILKLMAKTASQRYQSAAGLKADLQECLNRLDDGDIAEFELAQHDFQTALQIPQKLYGRASEMAALEASLRRITAGPCEFVVVKGYSGVGKTSVVHELHKSIGTSRGTFLAGKFDQFKRGIPYSSLAEAFRTFVRQILGESQTVIEQWRRTFLGALQNNGRILIDLIPELELIVGHQEPPEVLPPTEAENRFHSVFRRFVRSLGQAGRPFVCFVDDLQWADLPSLRLLDSLVRDPEARHMLFIGAFRDNEVDASHPLTGILDELGRQLNSLTVLELPPLSIEHVQELLAETLKRDAESVESLAKLCHKKTHGNPFFLTQFIQSLGRLKLLRFDSQQKRWNWDLQDIRDREITDNVVDFMAAKIRSLNPQAQQLMAQAAIVGNTFSRSLLGALNVDHAAPLDDALQQLLQEELIHHVKPSYQSPEPDPDQQYRFLHDRVQQAAQSLNSEEQARDIHWALGQHWLQKIDRPEDSEQLFDILSHLNKALSLASPEHQKVLATLNYHAGDKAKHAAAYQPALEYLNIARRLSAEQSWREQYSFRFELERSSAEVAFLCTAFEAMEQHVELAAKHAQSVLDRSRVLEIRLLALIAQNRLLEALNTGLEILTELDMQLPADPGQFHVVSDLVKTKWLLSGRSSEQLVALPKATDPRLVASLRILGTLAAPAYFARPQLVPILAFRIVQNSVRHGIAPESTYGFAVYALVLCSLGEIPAGYQYGQVAIKLLDHFHDDRMRTRITHIYYGFVRHWKEPISEIQKPYKELFQLGVDTGELEYASYVAMMFTIFAYYLARDLATAEVEIQRYTDAQRAFKQVPSLDIQLNIHQAILNLRGQSQDPTILTGDVYDEEEMLKAYTTGQDQDPTKLFVLCCIKVSLNVLFGHPQKALDWAAKAREVIDGGRGTFHLPVFHWNEALACLSLLSETTGREARSLRKRIQKNRKQLAQWCQHGPKNHAHRLTLIDAEWQRISGNKAKAMELYDLAIQQAEIQGFTGDQGQANERAARYFLEQKHRTVGRAYLIDAYYRYQEWGATAKAELLTQEFPWLLTGAHQHRYPRDPRKGTGTHATSDLDLSAVIKASQVISKEIILPNLVQTLVQLSLEVSGARKGLLVSCNDSGLVVECEGRSDIETIAQSLARPLEHYQGCPRTIIQYVLNTQDDVILANAVNSPLFKDDPYIVRNETKSVLCLPVKQQSESKAILYLENNLSAGAFSEQRIELLRVLLSQAAISIENAAFYNTLERRVEERTRKLQEEIRERTRVQEELRRLATTDSLTKASNRRHFLELSDKEFKRAQRYEHALSVIMIDADQFKSINDKHGHDIGDEVLIALTACCLKQLRNSDSFGRLGGEEFAATLPETSQAEAHKVGERLRQSIEDLELSTPSGPLKFTVSVGLAFMNAEDESFNAVLKRADECLYQAKETGRNRVVYEGMNNA